MLSNEFKIGFVGLGRMGSALLNGFLESGLENKNVCFVETDLDKQRVLSKEFGIDNVTLKELIMSVDILFLCIKPQGVSAFLEEVSAYLPSRLCIVSVCAGVRLTTLQSVHHPQPVIRVMPNTPVMVGVGVSAYSASENVLDSHLTFVTQLLESVGMVVSVEESQLDAITGLSGSGPAFVYQLINSVAQSVQEDGIKYEDAVQIAAQTFLGAAQMIRQTARLPQELTDEVTSPNGTTAAGLSVFESEDIHSSLQSVIRSAINRSIELSKE